MPALEEIKRLDPRLKSKWWRMTHLYKIQDEQGKLVTLKFNETQLKHLWERKNHKRIKILKGRKLGFTTLYVIDNLDDSLWNPGVNSGIIAHERELLDKIFQIVERAFNNLPESIKPTTRQDTLRMMRFERRYDGVPLDSSIYVAMKLRGSTLQNLHVAERAHIEGVDSQELEAGSKEAVPITGRISEETTGNGMNEFYDGFMEAWENKDPAGLDEAAFFYPWWQHSTNRIAGTIDEYTKDDEHLKQLVREAYGVELEDEQVLWYRWKKKSLAKTALGSGDRVGLTGAQLMKQEHPSTVLEAFQSGFGNVFDLAKLEGIDLPDPEMVLEDGTKIWHKVEKDKRYFLGADPPEGLGGDPGAIVVWDEDYRKCAEWRGNIRPDEAADKAMIIGHMYNDAFAGIENNLQSMIMFFAKIYDNYFSTVKVDERKAKKTKKIGWTTSGKSRDIMIDDYNMHFDEDTLEINSSTTVSEMRTFVKKKSGKREHADGKHDDVLIADMIALQMIKYKDRSKQRKRVFAAKPSGL